MLRFAACLLILIPVLCQERGQRPARSPAQSASAPQPDIKPGSVRGTVVSASGEPLRKAELSLRQVGGRGGVGPPEMAMRIGPGGAQAQTTDANGSFYFENVTPGSYVISAQRPGYVRADYGARPGSRSSATPIVVEPGKEVTGIQVKLTPQAVITGRVTDEDGDPVMQAMVQVIRQRWINGRKQNSPLAAASTDDRGEYRLAGLMPGRYFVMVNLNRPLTEAAVRPPSTTGDRNYTPSFYPGVGELSQAAPVEIPAGQETRGVDLQLRKNATWRVRGRVLDETGKPATNLSVMAAPADGGHFGIRAMGMVRNVEGTFEIAGLPPGSYLLIANRAGRNEPRTMARTAVQVGNRDVDGVVVQMQKTFEVSGFVRAAGEGAQTGTPRVTVEPLEPGIPFFGGNSAEVKPDGTWQVNGMSPGRYRFALSGLPDGTYLKSVLAGGQDIMAGASVSSPASGIELIIGANAPEVTGTVLNGDKQPVAESRIVLVPEPSKVDQFWLFRTASADSTGTFRLRGIAPGQYTAFALDASVEDGIWHNPDFLKTIQGRGAALKLAEGSRETLQLTLAP